MSLRLNQCSDYPGGADAMAFTITYTRGPSNPPADYDGPLIAGGDDDAETYRRSGDPTTKGGVNLMRRMRPGWWAIDYSYSGCNSGEFTLNWSMYDPTGDTGQGTETVYPGPVDFGTTPPTPSSGSGSYEWLCIGDSSSCSGILFGIYTTDMVYIAIGPPLVSMTGTWLACPDCPSPFA